MEIIKSNYQKAKEEADKVDAQIIEALEQGISFRVEAGAGSGKTYSLIKAIDWIQNNKWTDYHKKKQNVICITYTNAAVEVINERIKEKSFIIPSTIHSFAWSSIKQYQNFLISTIKGDTSLHPKEGDIDNITNVEYTLGHKYIENNTLYLYHNDVILLFSLLLDSLKFRSVFASKYPLILIDEYQDSFKIITDKFIKYFISQNKGPQFGFYGDAWQTIYQANNACGLIEHENIREIKKGSNFRSGTKIVDSLNIIRPQLPQISAIDDFDGEVYVINCNDFKGGRRTDQPFKDDLPIEVLQERVNKLNDLIKTKIDITKESIKNLMLTHNVLANQQGYEQIIGVVGDSFKDKDDVILLFFMNIVEPVFKALETSDMSLLFDTLKIKRYPVEKKADKKIWANLFENLKTLRNQKAIDVLKEVIESKLIPISDKVEKCYKDYYSEPEKEYKRSTISQYLNLDYKQFLSAIDFLYPESEFSTEHGVKGEEYDNVIFVISRGWNNYKFDEYIPMINTSIPSEKESSFERNRNLFYVCCSRPKKRLFIFVSVPVNDKFETFLKGLSGENNYFNYKEFIAANPI